MTISLSGSAALRRPHPKWSRGAEATTDLACTSRPTLVRSTNTGASHACDPSRPLLPGDSRPLRERGPGRNQPHEPVTPYRSTTTSVIGWEESAGRSRRRRRAAAGDELGAEGGDHRAVVGAQPGARDADADARGLRRARWPSRAAGSWRRRRHRSGGPRCPGRWRRRAPCGSARRRPPPGRRPRRRRRRPARAVALLGLDPAGDRGLEPGEREVEAVPLEVAAGGQAAREVDGDRGRRGRPGRCAGRPGTAGRAAAPPCRTPRRRRRRWSRRAARRRRSRRRPAAARSDRPRPAGPGTARAAAPCSSWSTATWAARWLTP